MGSTQQAPGNQPVNRSAKDQFGATPVAGGKGTPAINSAPQPTPSPAAKGAAPTSTSYPAQPMPTAQPVPAPAGKGTPTPSQLQQIAAANPNINPTEITDLQGMTPGGQAYNQQIQNLQSMGVQVPSQGKGNVVNPAVSPVPQVQPKAPIINQGRPGPLPSPDRVVNSTIYPRVQPKAPIINQGRPGPLPVPQVLPVQGLGSLPSGLPLSSKFYQ